MFKNQLFHHYSLYLQIIMLNLLFYHLNIIFFIHYYKISINIQLYMNIMNMYLYNIKRNITTLIFHPHIPNIFN